MLKIYIIDDHQLVAEGLAELINHHPKMCVLGMTQSPQKAMDELLNTGKVVVLMDYNLRDTNGAELCEKLLAINPELKILGISMNCFAASIKQMLKAGASGYVLKSISKNDLYLALEEVAEGKVFLDVETNRILIESIQHVQRETTPGFFPPLSNREKEVLKLLMEEHTTQEIALRLSISHHTVEAHRKNMLVKLGARNTVGLVCLALNYHLLD